jgi:hypothetical protein
MFMLALFWHADSWAKYMHGELDMADCLVEEATQTFMLAILSQKMESSRRWTTSRSHTR